MIGTKPTTDGLNITSAAITDRGLSEKRPQNEDSYLDMRAIGIFAVADGVGGAQAGEVASQMAVEILGEAFTNLQPNDDAETVMRSAMSKANSAIFQMAHELPQLSSMATTIVALHLNGNIATIGHVGDSRVYRVSQHGDLARETNDHSVVAEEVRAGRMTEEQADNHPSKNVISRALGAEGSVEPDLKTIMVEPGTSFLLCSDGITRHVSDEEIRNVLLSGSAPEAVCQHLRNLCYERGAEDNLTAVMVSVGETSERRTDDLPVLQLDDEETTVAGSRPSTNALSGDDDLLELETRELPSLVPPIVAEPVAKETLETQPISTEAEPAIHESFSQEDTVSNYQPTTSAQSIQVAEIPAQARNESFSMFGASEMPEPKEGSSSLGKIAMALGMLIVGGMIGFGVYHYLIAPKPDNTNNVGQLTEMRSANIPLSAFEENRRNVDKDPAGYIVRFGASPQDCEDYYLLGRAYLLTGDYLKAKTALTEARSRIAEADPVNAKTLSNEIAVSLAVLNDTTVQAMLKKELEAAGGPANANANATVNR